MANHGRYIGINYTGSRNALAGCINDAQDWRNLHKPILATSALLLEEQATKAGILRFVKAALALLKPADWLILQISGHGSHQPDRTKIEPDGRNELFCPYDLDKQVIFDNEWHDLLGQRHPDSRVLFITDCCHSGTLARSRKHQRTRPRFIDFQQLAQGMHPNYRETLYARRRRSEQDGVAEGVVHLSGCADDQVSYDATFNGRSNGAMSHFAIDAWRQLAKLHKAGEPATFVDWYRLLRMQLPNDRFDQRPQINAHEDWLTLPMPGFEAPPPEPPPAGAGKPPDLQITAGEWEAAITWRRRAA